MELKAIEFKQKTGLEVIVSQGKKRNLINFWQWAYSDLVGNTERGYPCRILGCIGLQY